MSDRTSLTILVVEDQRHKMLIYRYLKKLGRNAGEIRVVQSPSGAGSAEAWVRKQFVQEIRVYRGRHAQTELIVLVDVDSLSVKERLSQLDDASRAIGQTVVDAGERAARLVPKRNVETWALCLNEKAVDENADYKGEKHSWITLISSAAENLAQYTLPTSEVPKYYIDSLRSGIAELKKLR